MKNIIDLNAEIEKVFKPKIYFHQDYQTFSFFDNWIIETNDEYFQNWEEIIKNKINNIADLDSPIKVKFLKIFHQDVLEKYKDLIKLDNTDIGYLKSIFDESDKTHKSKTKPKKTCRDISDDKNSLFYITKEEYRHTIDILGTLFFDHDFLFFPEEDCPIEGEKSFVENAIFKYFEDERKEIIEKTIKIREEKRISFENAKWSKDEIEFHLNQFNPFIKTYTKEEQLEKAYSFYHLSRCLNKTRLLLKNIINYLDNVVSIIKKLENFEEDKYTLEEVFEGDPNNLKLEFKISKKEIAILFKNLSDFGYFHVDNTGFKHKYTQLKKYINNANMYFPQNGEMKPVKGINKEFSKVYGNEERIMHQNMEKEFLKDLIEKSTERIEKIDSEDY